MKVINTVQEFQAYRSSLPPTTSIGFVPTMGCLHAGHASLLQRSREENKVSILSIFVNPTQFNDPADYARYPQTVENDLTLAKAQGVDCVFMPNKSEMYPSEDLITCTTAQNLSQIMEGFYRPGHFNGMLTIVLKLLLLIRPTHAYFGEKDYQQYRLIQSLRQNFLLETQIIGCPTLREPSGLAMSSRNTLLNVEERVMADYFAQIFYKVQPESLDQTRVALEQKGIVVEYLQTYEDRILVAVRVGRIRLIDNRKPIKEPL